MSDLLAELVHRARELPPEDQARLAQELPASLEETLDPAAQAAWDEELRRRIAEVDSGAVHLAPADEDFARARRAQR